LLSIAALVALVAAQDPAPGWMGYAQGLSPNGHGRITYIEAKWKVGQNPTVGGAFYSPWFGIDTSDNMNLLQPVNPWLGDSWVIYNEYYQWDPEYNYNSDQIDVRTGDELFGSLEFNPDNQTYTIVHTVLNTGRSVTTNMYIQQDENGDYKNYTIAYFVMEKSEWDCDQYGPDGKVVFYDIKVEYDNKVVTPKWSTGVVDDTCNCRAHLDSTAQISITWDTQAKKSATHSSNNKQQHVGLPHKSKKPVMKVH